MKVEGELIPAFGVLASDAVPIVTASYAGLPPEEKRIVKALLEGMIIKHQTKQLVGNLSS